MTKWITIKIKDIELDVRKIYNIGVNNFIGYSQNRIARFYYEDNQWHSEIIEEFIKIPQWNCG